MAWITLTSARSTRSTRRQALKSWHTSRDGNQQPHRISKGPPKSGWAREGTLNKVTLEIRLAARQIVEDPQYLARLRESVSGEA